MWADTTPTHRCHWMRSPTSLLAARRSPGASTRRIWRKALRISSAPPASPDLCVRRRPIRTICGRWAGVSSHRLTSIPGSGRRCSCSSSAAAIRPGRCFARSPFSQMSRHRHFSHGTERIRSGRSGTDCPYYVLIVGDPGPGILRVPATPRSGMRGGAAALRRHRTLRTLCEIGRGQRSRLACRRRGAWSSWLPGTATGPAYGHALGHDVRACR